MTFQPILPASGYLGWTFLERTRERQEELHAASPPIARDADAFRARIGTIERAEDLVADRQLLRVALGAFGLGDDLDNTYFVRKVLEDGIEARDALANRLADKRYFALAEAFGFGGPGQPQTAAPGFADRIVAAYESRSFEVAVGAQDETMRLVLGLARGIEEILARPSTDDGHWFAVMGQPPVRKVFEVAFGLPGSFGTLDIDQQLTTFRDKARSAFGEGEVAQFADPERREELIRRFLVRSEIAASGAGLSGQAVALNLLQSAPQLYASPFSSRP